MIVWPRSGSGCILTGKKERVTKHTKRVGHAEQRREEGKRKGNFTLLAIMGQSNASFPCCTLRNPPNTLTIIIIKSIIATILNNVTLLLRDIQFAVHEGGAAFS